MFGALLLFEDAFIHTVSISFTAQIIIELIINITSLLFTGGVIMFGALLLFEDEFIHVVSISFTALIMTELIMVALTIRTWHWLMVLAEFASLVIYILSLVILKDFFGEYLKKLLRSSSF